VNDVKNRRILVIDGNEAIHVDFRKILSGSPTSAKLLAGAEASLFGDSSNGTEPEWIDSAF
jgi:hypothetical protein